MLAAIAAPILPSPMKAIVNLSSEEVIAEYPLFPGHRLNDDRTDYPTKTRIRKLGFGRAVAPIRDRGLRSKET
jgi:hypothetical protein